MNFLATGETPGRLGNAHPNIVPYQTFKTSDGDIILACGNDKLFAKFCDIAGCRDLAQDARFATTAQRVENRTEITRRRADVFRTRTTREWVQALDKAGVPNGPINNIRQVFEEPQVIERGMKLELPHSSAGKVPLVASPMRFSKTPIDYLAPPPTLGEHTDEILHGVLGMSEADIRRLRGEGVI